MNAWIGRPAPAVGYAAGLGIGTALLGGRPAVVRFASTNLDNLHTHPVASLLLSAFVVEDSPVGWIVLGLVGLAAVGWVLGGWRTALLVAVAHVLGTLVSQGILAHRIASGAAPAADRAMVDVGASYVVVCALAAGIAYSRWPGRLACVVGFALVAPHLFGGLTRWEVPAVGHVCAIAVGLGLGWPLAWAATRRRGSGADPAPPVAEEVC
jgi:hypothetical protein